MTTPTGEKTYDLVVDSVTKRPACVLLQAGYGCNSHLVSELFDSKTWHLSPRPTFVVVNGTLYQWKGHAEKINKAVDSQTD